MEQAGVMANSEVERLQCWNRRYAMLKYLDVEGINISSIRKYAKELGIEPKVIDKLAQKCALERIKTVCNEQGMTISSIEEIDGEMRVTVQIKD